MNVSRSARGDGASPSLGVVAISYNEERDLVGFLDNLLPWVDEIIIVDDGSTDRTCQIARLAGAKVTLLDSPRREGEYFAEQRNKGIDAATSDWLLHMDIDERVPPELAVEIRSALSSAEYDAFRFRRRNYFLHRPMKGGGWTAWNHVHLARRECLRFSGMYHEKIALSPATVAVGQLTNKMIHLNDDSLTERFGKSQNYQIEIAENIRGSGKAVGGAAIGFAFLKQFVYKYLWQKGFLDGTVGLVWALHAATAHFRSYAMVWDARTRIPREQLEAEIHAAWRQLPDSRTDSTEMSKWPHG